MKILVSLLNCVYNQNLIFYNFSKHKNSKRQQHRELITGKPAKGKKKAAPSGPVVTREEAEEVEYISPHIYPNFGSPFW